MWLKDIDYRWQQSLVGNQTSSIAFGSFINIIFNATRAVKLYQSMPSVELKPFMRISIIDKLNE